MQTPPAELESASFAQRLRTRTFVRHLDYHAELPSTNTHALALAAQGRVPLPALVIAGRQTAGRGRGGHNWQSAAGSLTVSLILDAPIAPSNPIATGNPAGLGPLVALAAGLALRDAAAVVVPGQVLRVKWPNDVYLCSSTRGNCKLAGILTETTTGGATAGPIVVGVGLNVNNSLAVAPTDVRLRAISLAEALGAPVDVAALLLDFLVRFEHELRAFAAAGGVPPERWQPVCLLCGQIVRLNTPCGPQTGRCLGVASDGALLLETRTGLLRCYSGEAVMLESP